MLRLYVASSNLKYSVTDALRRLRGDTAGVTAIEYGLIAGAIAVAIIATVIALGGVHQKPVRHDRQRLELDHRLIALTRRAGTAKKRGTSLGGGVPNLRNRPPIARHV